MNEIMSRVKSLFQNPGKALTSKCPKNDNPSTVVVHFNIDSHNKYDVACKQSWGLYTYI